MITTMEKQNLKLSSTNLIALHFFYNYSFKNGFVYLLKTKDFDDHKLTLLIEDSIKTTCILSSTHVTKKKQLNLSRRLMVLLFRSHLTQQIAVRVSLIVLMKHTKEERNLSSIIFVIFSKYSLTELPYSSML